MHKNITKKVQAYFKHLCALKLKFEAKKDMSVYNQNLPYSIFLWRKSPTVIARLFASVYRSSSPGTDNS